MARLLIGLVLLMMCLSQIALAEDMIKLGRKGAGSVSVGQNLENGGGANNVVVACGHVKARPAERVLLFDPSDDGYKLEVEIGK
ncbi:hypothetical protein MKW94_010267 [Papaver nudicaule]|uniref:Uncharacterized protein n=1 Tax=Papaver nudicaule TaxID=74823 RepID=A0AA41UZZ5_PAPNU|nr:hypothetical protein [Papaver nudicaule]